MINIIKDTPVDQSQSNKGCIIFRMRCELRMDGYAQQRKVKRMANMYIFLVDYHFIKP